MDRKNDLKLAISDWVNRKLPDVISREVDVPLNSEIIITMVGPRRSGKTYFMYSIIRKLGKNIPESNILYINFEHERLRHMSSYDLTDLISLYYELCNPDDSKPVYLFFDEIQVVQDWSIWINRLFESKKFHIYLSGSSSKLLSLEIATELRGRSIDFLILPYSFREFLKVQNIDIKHPELMIYSENRGLILSALLYYMKYGSYPETLQMEGIRDKLLKMYMDTIIVKDVGERYKIEPSILTDIFYYIINNYSKYLSGTKIYNYLKTLNYKISAEKPLQILRDFNEAFSIFTLDVYSRSFKSRKQYPKKVYIVDTGFVHIFLNKMEYGRLMENIVFMELYRRSDSFELFQVYYWREYGKSNGKEIDFIVVKNGVINEMINVTYARNEEDIADREIESFKVASEELGSTKKTLITWDYNNPGDINCIPLWKWLLNL